MENADNVFILGDRWERLKK